MLARFVLGALAAGAVIAPALAGQMNAEEARRFVAGKVFAFTCFDGTRGAGRMLDDMGRGRRGAVQRLRSGASHPAARQYAADPRPGRLRVDQGHSVRAVLQPRQEGRASVSADRCPAWASPIAISITRARPQMLMARAVARPRSLRPAGADRLADRGVRARRNPAGRERQNRAGQVRAETRAGQIGARSGIASLDRVTIGQRVPST